LKNLKKTKRLLPLLTLITFFSVILPRAYAQGTIMSVAPSVITVGEEGQPLPTDPFIVNITVANVVDLQNWQVRLDFDPSILNITDPENDIFHPSDHVFAGHTIFAPAPVVYNPDPESPLGASLLWTTQDLDLTGFDGNGTLCSIRFVGIGVGTTELILRLTPPGNCFLEDLEGNDISFTAEDGSVTVIPEFPFLLAPVFMVATLVAIILANFKLQIN